MSIRKNKMPFLRFIYSLLLFSFLSNFCFSENSTTQDNIPVLRGPYLGQRPPGNEPEIFAAGIISVSKEHSSPAFSPDGKDVFWCTMRNTGKTEVYYMKEEEGIWSKPEFFCSGRNPFFSIDGKKLYYTTIGGPFNSRNVKMRTRTGKNFSKAKNLGFPFDSTKLMWNPSITANGTIYFTMFEDKQENYIIYKATIIENKYTAPERLSDEINEFRPSGPFVAPDESYLIFQSERSGGYGGDDLYICYQKQTGGWTDPINLGNKINTNSHEYYARVSPDGRYFFFIRGAKIFWVNTDFIEKLKPIF